MHEIKNENEGEKKNLKKSKRNISEEMSLPTDNISKKKLLKTNEH
jgi:hypothetical protein